jgi:hypothetical protein
MPSLFSPQKFLPVDLYNEAGIEFNSDSNIKSDFVTPWIETFIDEAKNYATKFDLNGINFDLMDKSLSPQLYRDAGFFVVETIVPTSQTDIDNFSAEYVILKPTIGIGSRVLENFPVSQLAYCVITKTTLLSVIQMDPGFYERQLTGNVKYILQEAIVTPNDIYDWIILSGAVNGSGELVLMPSIRGNRYVKNRVVDSKLSCSDENDTPELLECKEYLANLVENTNFKNTVFQLQLIKHSNGKITPLDFGYRFSYQIKHNLESPVVRQYAINLIRFAYDLTPVKPTLNIVTAVSVNNENSVGGYQIIKGVTGSTREEALGKL